MTLAIGACLSCGKGAGSQDGVASESLAGDSEGKAENNKPAAFAKSLADAIDSCNTKALRVLFDLHAIVRRAGVVSESGAPQINEWLKIHSEQVSNSPLHILCRSRHEDTNSQAIAIPTVENKGDEGTKGISFVVRQTSDLGVDYLEFGASWQGKAYVADSVYSAYHGLYLSERLQAAHWLQGSKSKEAVQFGKGVEMLRQGDASGLSQLNSLPSLFKNHASVSRFREALEGASAFRRTPLWAAVFWSEQADWSRALRSLDEAMLVYPDKYLLLLRALFNLARKGDGDLARAGSAAEELISFAPWSTAAHHALLTIRVEEGNYSEAIKGIEVMQERFDMIFESAGFRGEGPAFDAFLKSEEWRQFSAR